MGLPQFNLYYTDVTNEGSYTTVTQHDCLYVATFFTYNEKGPYQIIPYCLSECPSKRKIGKNIRDQNFTFAELRTRNITSQQLYLWSVPIDLIERYQFYLGQAPTLSETEVSREVFYNCTLPWFGPMCQYMFDQYESHHSSFAKIVYDYYQNKNEMSSLTCYIHLECNRGTPSMCLDWTDICNGIIDCIDGGQDEKYCWQLEVNDCQENEYRCHNGQCIPKIFHRDNVWHPDCLDGSDEIFHESLRDLCVRLAPIFSCEEVTCRLFQNDDRNLIVLSPNSCVKERGKLLMQEILAIKQTSVPDTCWFALICIVLTVDQIGNIPCQNFCEDNVCDELIEENCPDFIRLPTVPVLSGHVHFVYTNKTFKPLIGIPMPKYVCYSEQHCNEMPTTITLLSLNNASCRHYHELPYQVTELVSELDLIVRHVQSLFRTCTQNGVDYSRLCNMPTMYQCFDSSKCISIYRLNDGIRDCYHDDDEQFVVTENSSLKPFKDCYMCKESNKCIQHHLLNDGVSHCLLHDDEDEIHSVLKHISFQTICDGFTDLHPITIDGREESDETECEQWPCHNIYTHCDEHGIWNCLNGIDELNCDTLPRSNCTSLEHLCVSLKTNQFMCLPIEQANDGIIDCLGATDERRKCRESSAQLSTFSFHCQNNGQKPCIFYGSVCNGRPDCIYGEDERFCGPNDGQLSCYKDPSMLSDGFLFFCRQLTDHDKPNVVHFSLGRANYIVQQTDNPKHKQSTLPPLSSKTRTNSQHEQRCHRGLDMRVWLGDEENSTTIMCFCPPNYYGDTCQYQNQRVSLTVKIQPSSDAWSTPFAFVVLLIDSDERMIHSHEQFAYLSAQDCQKEFDVFLLYSIRPKNETKHYSIHIDVYEKESLNYRSSWLIPLTFPFLPVHRTIAQLLIPRHSDTGEICPDVQCLHGQCTKYTNNNSMINTTFCRCNEGWTGRYCNISYTCNCAKKSQCVGVSVENRSICVCPLTKFGSRCSLDDTTCQFTSCHNGGKCVPVDSRIAGYNVSCICPKGFSGNACEINDTKIIISFEKNIILSQSVLVHFIQVLDNKSPARNTIFKNILVDQNSVTVFWPHPFHLMFIEPSKNIYYLTVIPKTDVGSTMLISSINSSHRCANISELFDEVFVKSHLLKRIKFYHVPCQNRSLELSCFYDDIHICLCTDFEQRRMANCLEFDYHMKHDCIGQSVCENDAQCFQDDPICPRASICMCTECFYGARCQFTTQGFGLSLDAILGYHIRPHTTLRHQSSTVQVTVLLTTIMFVLGLINGILSLITFEVRKLREVGCGIYLMGSSITSILTMTLFAVKFWLLVLSQMGSITNRSFLRIQCTSMDFLVRVCLSMDQWLNACVAVERAITSLKGIKFSKKKSSQAAKWVILALSLLTTITCIQDPIYRRLINDENDDEQRTWCIVTYSIKLEVFNSTMNIVHFLVPFLINVASAIVIIITTARRRSFSHPHQTYRQNLRDEFQQHRQLLLAPCVLTILAFPRLFISFVSSCMKSARAPWLFLAGYYISFVPPMLTFVVFVTPSDLYKKEFHKSIKRHVNTICRCLRINS